MAENVSFASVRTGAKTICRVAYASIFIRQTRIAASFGSTLAAVWDLTTKAARALNAEMIDKTRLQQIEAEVTAFMVENFSFAVLSFETQAKRLHYEQCLLSTIHQCRDCGPSETWLGRYHPTSAVIRIGGGLWNVQGLAGSALSSEQAKHLVRAGMVA
jgi:hypothetical protein